MTCYILANGDGLGKYGVEKAQSINCKSSVICSEWKYNNNGNEVPVKVTIDKSDETSKYCTDKLQ